MVDPGRERHEAPAQIAGHVRRAAQVERLAEHCESPDQRARVEVDAVHDVGDRAQAPGHGSVVDRLGHQPQCVHAHVRPDARHRVVHLVDHLLESLHGHRAGDRGG